MGFTGLAIGAAMEGLRPIVEYMYIDLTLLAMDQIMNQAAKLRYMTSDIDRIFNVIYTPKPVFF